MIIRKGIIYKATDRIIFKSYIGQSLNTLETRRDQHIKFALNKLDRTYFSLFYKMIRFFGPENFDWEIVEKDISKEKLDEKEVFYIKKFNTYEDGYNSSMGGQIQHGSKILTEEDAIKIIEYLKDESLTMTDIANKFPGCSREIVSDINCGETWHFSDITYPVREKSWNQKINFSEEEILKMIDLLKNTSKSYKEISKIMNCNPTTIKKISDGETYHMEGISYPIRKKMFSHRTDEDVLKVAKLLSTTKLTNVEISKKTGIDVKIISNIKNGVYHKKLLNENGFVNFPICKK